MPVLVTSEHGIKFQMDLLRGMGTCEHLQSFLLLRGKDLQNKARLLNLSFFLLRELSLCFFIHRQQF